MTGILAKYVCFACGVPVCAVRCHRGRGKNGKRVLNHFERKPWQIFCVRHAWIWRKGFVLIEES